MGKGKKTKHQTFTRQLVTKDDDDDDLQYAKVVKVLGNGRYTVFCFDNKERLAHIRGSLRRRSRFVVVDAILLVSLREFQDDKCDIVHIYNHDEKMVLERKGHIPTSEVTGEEDEFGFFFDKEDILDNI